MTLDDERQRWERQVLAPLTDRFPERKPSFQTSSGMPLPRMLTPPHADPGYLDQLGFPGEYPFTRGVQPTMYRGRLWTMRQYAGYASAAESNRRYRYLLEQGQTGLSVAFDLPTQIGYDADDPLAAGEVGKVGVSISSLEDMQTLFHEHPSGKGLHQHDHQRPGCYLVGHVYRRRPPAGCGSQTTARYHPERYPQGIYRPRHLYLPAQTFHAPDHRCLPVLPARPSRAGTPSASRVTISGRPVPPPSRKWPLPWRMVSPTFRPRSRPAWMWTVSPPSYPSSSMPTTISWRRSPNSGPPRRLWARIMRERFGAQNPNSWKLRFHTQTAGSTLTAQQPENNVVRVALQALAAVLGGTQSLHTNSMDEALWLPTEKSVRVALRTQQVIAHESGVADSIDPLAGSYLVEHLTDEIESRAEAYLHKIDEMGGALAAIQSGLHPGRDSGSRLPVPTRRGSR